MSDRPATVTWGIAFGQTHVLADLVAGVELAERYGYDYFWYGNEKLHPDMWIGLSMAALHSRSLRVGTFVADPYSQHPAATAAMIATLDHYSGGRAVLVMGAGGSGLRELGIERRRPVEAVGKALAIIRQILRGELATSDEPPFPVQARLHFPPRPDIPLWIATRGTSMLELAGRVADGVMIGTIARAVDIKGALEVVAKGAAEAGRDVSALTASVRVDVSVADDAGEARAAVRSFVAGVLSASYPDRGFVERAGLTVPDELEAVCRTKDLRLAWASQALVPDELVDAFTWAGTPAGVAGRVAAAIDLGIDNVTVVFHGAAAAQLAQAGRFNAEVLPAVDALVGRRAAEGRAR